MRIGEITLRSERGEEGGEGCEEREEGVVGGGERVPSYHAASIGPLIFAALRFCLALSTLHTSTADRGHKTLYIPGLCACACSCAARPWFDGAPLCLPSPPLPHWLHAQPAVAACGAHTHLPPPSSSSLSLSLSLPPLPPRLPRETVITGRNLAK